MKVEIIPRELVEAVLNRKVTDIIDAGTDRVNLLESDILDIKKLREDYPDLIFCGGVDNNDLLYHGTIKEVEQAVRDLIREAESNGRLLLLCSSGQIHLANKLKNCLSMFEFGRKYEKY